MSLTYLITGASSGIGECFAQELAKAGHDLVLVARRLDRLEKLAEDLQNQFQIKCYCFSCDLSKRDETLALIEKIKSQNIEIDGLINNAGFSVAREFHNTELSAQMDFVETCVTAPTILCHAFLPQMRAKKFGRIINVSSMVAFSNGAAGHSLYPAAKSYILKMSRSLAAENCDLGINITALCPGATQSEFQTNNGMNEKMGKDNILKPMPTIDVVKSALEGNSSGKEIVISGFANKFAVAMMKFVPEFILNPIIRREAKKMVIK